METISEVILDKNGFLFEEPTFLLKEEIREPINYFSIIRAIATGNRKLGNIANELSGNGSTLTPYLTTLIDLGYLEKQVPITEKNPEKSRKGLYSISDNFMRFWFSYIFPFKGELELGNTQIVLEEINKDFISNFVAFAYEDICKEIFVTLCNSSAIPFMPSKTGSYWMNGQNQSIKIDVMAVDNTHKIVFQVNVSIMKNLLMPMYISICRKRLYRVLKYRLYSVDIHFYMECFQKAVLLLGYLILHQRMKGYILYIFKFSFCVFHCFLRIIY